MNYFKYILSDRKAMKYWIFYYSLLLLIIVTVLLSDPLHSVIMGVSLFDIAIYIIVLFPFFTLYLSSYVNYRNQIIFLRKYSERIKKDSIQTVPVEIQMSSSFLRIVITGRLAQIDPKPRLDTFTVIQIDNNIGLLGQTYDLGIIRQHFKPMIVPITDSHKTNKYANCISVDEVEISRESDDMVIKFKNMPHGINKLRLIRWHQINPTN